MNKNKIIKILLVDDEDRFRTTMVATLERRGFSVRAVASGSKAIEEIQKNNIDVVVLDVKMPGMDGHQTLREIKRLKPEVEVIMLTAYPSIDSSFEVLHNNVFAYLCKPCDVDLLVNRIREAMGWKELRAEP